MSEHTPLPCASCAGHPPGSVISNHPSCEAAIFRAINADLLAALEECDDSGINLLAAICDLGMNHEMVGPSMPRFAKAMSQAYTVIKKAKLPA